MYRTTESLPAIYVNARTIHEELEASGDHSLTCHSCKMPISVSRQTFLPSEIRECELNYERKGGFFVSRAVCCVLVLLAVLTAVTAAAVTYFLAREKSLFSTPENDIWSAETEKLESTPSPDLRLPKSIIPSFYRLKLIPKLQESIFTGEVYITLKTKESGVKKIILHSKDLDVDKNKVTVTEQVYQRIETHNGRFKRRADEEVVHLTPEGKSIVSNSNSTFESKLKSALTNPQMNKKNSEIINDVLKNSSKEVNESTVKNKENIVDLVMKKESNHNENSAFDSSPNIPTVNIQVTQSNTRNITIASVEINSEKQRLIISLDSALKPNVDYTLELRFNGKLTNSLTGFYKSSYIDADKKTKELTITQFEPASARAAFPCFDEPELKAMFEISIAHPANLTALSNMPVASKEPMTSTPGWLWTHFDRSVKMSTYLVAYGTMDFSYLESSYTGMDKEVKTIRVWTRKEMIHQAKYAVSIAPRMLAFYEEWFGVPCALGKLDLVAIPDFSAGAMENWGLITFREAGLLYDDNSNSTAEKQAVATVVAHELAHQWFGNLVTMSWWNDLWLNEGFASYMQHIAADHIEPSWHILDSLMHRKMGVLRDDALYHTTALSAVINEAAEITQKFDEISYFKGAALLQWLSHVLTAEVFRKGLTGYLNKWKYSNAEEEDLWSSMSEAASSSNANLLNNISLVQLMKTWTRQPGLPMVTVRVNYSSNQVTFVQSLFSTVPTSKSRQNQIWWIPISFVTLGNNTTAWDTRPKLWLQEREKTINISISDNEALYVNVENIGYYRVNYDTQNWNKLSRSLLTNHAALPNYTRAQLLDDAFNLAKASRLPYETALDLTAYLVGETSDMVWGTVFANLAFIQFTLRTTPYLSAFDEYTLHLMDPILKHYSYGERQPESEKERLFADRLLSEECKSGSTRCIKWATALFGRWLDGGNVTDNPIPKRLRNLVYFVAVKYGTRAEFNFLWEVYRNTTDQTEQDTVLQALTATRDDGLFSLLLERSMSEIPARSAGVVWAADCGAGLQAAQRFLVDNWGRVLKTFGGAEFAMREILEGAFGSISTKEDLKRFKRFVEDHMADLKSHKQLLLQLADSAALKIDWVERHAARVADWVAAFNKRAADNKYEGTRNTSRSELPKNYTEQSLLNSRQSSNNNNSTDSPRDSIFNKMEILTKLNSTNNNEALLQNATNIAEKSPEVNVAHNKETLPQNVTNIVEKSPEVNVTNNKETLPQNVTNTTDTSPKINATNIVEKLSKLNDTNRAEKLSDAIAANKTETLPVLNATNSTTDTNKKTNNE